MISSEARRAATPEAPKTPELSISSSVCRLGKNQEAACAGQEAHIGYLERGADRAPLSDTQKNENAQKVAQALRTIKKTGREENSPPEDYKAEDVLNVGNIIQELTGENGPYAGILFQCPSLDNQSETGINSACLMTIVVHELASSEMRGKTQSEVLPIIQKKLHDTLGYSASPFSIALIDKKGNLSVENGPADISMVVIDSEGNKTIATSGTQLKSGEKIIIGEKTKIDGLKVEDAKGKGLEDIVSSTMEQHASAAAEVEEKPAAAPSAAVENEVVITFEKVKYEDDKDEPPQKIEEYIHKEEFQRNNEWLHRVIENIQSSDSTDPVIISLKRGARDTDEIAYTKKVVRALQKHLAAVGENENSPLSRLAAEAEDVTKEINRGSQLTTLDAVSVLLKKAPELYDPKFKTTETEGNPEEVKSAFSEAYGLYEGEMQALVNKDITTLSNEEKEVRARFLYTKAAYERAKGTKDWQLDVELRAHGALPSHMIVEGVPVEGVMFFLQTKIDAATTAGNQEEVTKFQALYDALKNNSKFYREIPLKDRHEKRGAGVRFKKVDELMEARQQLEANQRHLDSLRTSHNQNDQARMQEDWDQGGRDLAIRRELVVPKKKRAIPSELGIVYQKKTNEREIMQTIVPDILPAPITEPDPRPRPPPIAPIPDPEVVITENDLRAQVVVAKENNRQINNNDNLTSHVMSKVETSGKHWYSRIPLLGGVVGSLLHPVQNIWRNGLARESVREQNRRFVDRMSITLKSHFVGGTQIDGQMRIPVELTSELIDESLEEGKKLFKKQGLLTRMWWGGRNAFAKITTIGETSQMHFAKEWMEDTLVSNRVGERGALIESIYAHALDEQDAVASRIAQKGLRIGERREEVANSPLATPIKQAVSEYFVEMERINTETDIDKKNKSIREAETRLVAKVNMLGKTTAGIGGSIDLNGGIELVSNILSVVKDLSQPFGETGKSKWKILQEQDKWKDFKINITTAESRWGAEGGEKNPMSKLREKVLKRMAERELLVGENERTHGVELAFESIASDISTYGGAFLLGAGSSAALFGVRTASKMVGGLGGIMGMSAAKEMGLRVGGHELFRGRYRGEVAQVSREVALGKKGASAARIRSEMGRALVEPGMMENADTIASRIEGLLSSKSPEQLTEAEAYQILKEISQLDARMRIADISGTRDLQFTTQNYIIYDELQRNQQYLRLKSNVLAGLQKLTLYKGLHSDFGHGEDISSGVQIEYGKVQGTLGMFEKFSALAEAQLRLGSRTEILKWLQDANSLEDSNRLFNNNAGLGMTKDEAKRLINEYYSEAKGTVDQEQSIRSKEKVLRRLATKRAATVVLQSALMMPIGGVVVGVEYQVISGVVQEAQQMLREGIPAWSADWHSVISGNTVPTHTLSPIQSAVLTVRHTIESTVHTENLPPHDEVIDGVHVQLPGEYKYISGPNGVDKIVDLHGNTVKDLSNIDLHIVDGKLVETNAAGQIINNDALADFHSSGIAIHQGESVLVNQSETVVSPTSLPVDQLFDGHTMHVPQGTEWIKDTQGNNDLVVVGHHDVVLIDNAHIGTDGLISGGTMHEGVVVGTASNTISGGSSQEIHISGADGILTQNHDTYLRTDRQSMYGGTETNGHQYHRPIADYKETNPDTGEAVYVIQAGRGDVLYPAHDPTITFNVPQEMAEGHLYFTISVPGHGDIVVPANYSAAHDNLNDALRLDPSDTHTFVTPQGHEFTYGEVAKMFVDQGNLSSHPDGILGTEYNDIWTQILHLTASDSPHPGTITSTILGDNGKLYDFGVVRGGAPLQDVITTSSPSTVMTESLITITGPINVSASECIPTFIIDAPAAVATPISIVIPLVPVPIGRENVEAVEGGSTPQERTTSPTQTPLTPTTTPPVTTSAENTLELSAAEKDVIKKEVESRPYAKPDEMLTLFGLKQGTSFGKYKTDDEKRASNIRYKECQDRLSEYEAARRAFENAPQTSKKQKEEEFKIAEKALIRTLRGREGRLIGAAPFDETQVEVLNTFLDEQKQKKLLEGIEDRRNRESLRLAKMFSNIQEPSNLNHSFRVKIIPSDYIALDQRSSYELPEVFYQIPEGQTRPVPNEDAAAYVYELGEYDLNGRDIPEDRRNKRYMAAKAASGESDLFAVAAASAETPKEQAKLYKYLSGSILAIHGHNPALLGNWFSAQEHSQISMNRLNESDRFKDQQLSIPITNVNERLLERREDGSVDETRTLAMWKARIPELEKAVKEDNLEEHHIRWIEFLAHSVKVPALIHTAQGVL